MHANRITERLLNIYTRTPNFSRVRPLYIVSDLAITHAQLVDSDSNRVSNYNNPFAAWPRALGCGRAQLDSTISLPAAWSEIDRAREDRMHLFGA